MSSTSRCSVAAVCAFIGVPSLPGGNFLPGSKPFAPDRGPGVLLYTRFLGLLQESSHFRGTPTGVPADSPASAGISGNLPEACRHRFPNKNPRPPCLAPCSAPSAPLLGPPCSAGRHFSQTRPETVHSRPLRSVCEISAAD